jgi:hypothetical protein
MRWIRGIAPRLLGGGSMRVAVLGLCEAAGRDDWWGVGYCGAAAATDSA